VGCNFDTSAEGVGHNPSASSCTIWYWEAVRALIEAGANINARDHEGWTPLDWASAWDKDKAVVVLRDAGAVVSPKESKASRNMKPELISVRSLYIDACGTAKSRW